MEFYQLEYFRVLCKYGNYTLASQELNVSQPALSMAIKKLEETCCGHLIDRKRKTFALTQKGETLLAWAVVIHNDMENMLQAIGAFSARQREVIRLAFPMPLCPELTSRIIPDFSNLHSDIAMHLIQAGHTTIVSSLLNGSVDLGIFCADMLTTTLESVPYKTLEYWACFSSHHHFCGCAAITPEMLMEETLIVPKGENSISKPIQEYFHAVQQTPQILYQDVFPENVRQLALEGKGIAFVPKHNHDEHCAPLSPPLYSRLVLAWRKGEKLTRQKKELIEFIRSAQIEC